MSDFDAAKVTALQVSTARRVVTAQIAAAGAEGDDNGAEQYEGAEVAQPAGLLAVPALTPTLEAFILRRGDEAVAVVLVDKGAAVQAVESGETRLYGVGADNPQAVIRIRAQGDVEVTPAAGRDVILNGGTLKVARQTDPVRVGVLSGTNGGGPVVFTFQPLDGDGLPSGPPIVNATVTITGIVSNAGGAPHVKA